MEELRNRYSSITGDKAPKDKEALLAEAQRKLTYGEGMSNWAKGRLEVFIRELKMK